MSHRDAPRLGLLPWRRLAPYLVGAAALFLVVALLLAGPELSGRQADDGAGPPLLPATATGAPAPTPAGGLPSAVASDSASATPRPTRSSARPDSAPPSPTSSPTPTLPGPPAKARTGNVVGPGGLCLDNNGQADADHNKTQMYGCNSTVAQVWTLATDGALHVQSRCLRITDSGGTGSRVELFTCDPGASTQQWRLLSTGAIVNPASGLCLTNPGASQTNGAQVVVSTCATPLTGVNGDQQWHVTG